jgi:hypothetical protein
VSDKYCNLPCSGDSTEMCGGGSNPNTPYSASVYLTSNLNQYLTHHWPIWSSQMNDQIGSAHMIQGLNTIFDADRFGTPNSALNLNGGWTYVPKGVFFDTPQFR